MIQKNAALLACFVIYSSATKHFVSLH